jgi:hypothetical protein
VPFVRTVGAGACNCVTRRCPTTPATRCSAPKQRSCLLQSVEQSSVVWKVCSIMGWRRRRTTTHHGLGCGSSQIIVVDDTGERRWVQTTFVRLFRHLHRYHRYWCDAVGGGGLDWPSSHALTCFGVDQPDSTVVHQSGRPVCPNTPSPIRAIFSLMRWPNETIGRIFLAGEAGRKGLPGAIFAERQASTGPSCCVCNKAATRRSVITRRV